MTALDPEILRRMSRTAWQQSPEMMSVVYVNDAARVAQDIRDEAVQELLATAGDFVEQFHIAAAENERLRTERVILQRIAHFAEKVVVWEDDESVKALGGDHELRRSAWQNLRAAIARRDGEA